MSNFAPSLSELKAMTDEELIQRYDRQVDNTLVSTGFFLDEIRYREAARLHVQVAGLTKLITALTIVITIATLLNVVVFLNDSPTIPGFIR